MRTSAWRGTWQPNQRPYVVLSTDVYMSLQGETSMIACGECRREVNFNYYITQISTEASVDSPPGSATVTLSIPDNDLNDFYSDGQFMIIPMMEIELFGKGYFSVGGIPQYYKIFWGMVSSVARSWSNGVTTIQLQCKDILRWWELTNVVLNPAFLQSFGTSAGNFQMFGNQFASMNPYTVIVQLAKEAMGDFSLTTGSFTSFTPETGPEGAVIGSYAKDIMAYWQLKFSNIWNSLVLYGSSGRAYTFTGEGGTVSGSNITQAILQQEEDINNKEGAAAGTLPSSAFKVHIGQLAAFKTELARAADIDFFQNESQSKLAIAMTARDQAGYEFYCDTTGDIVFKPPFYNLNVLPNKPVSWIQDFEIIEDTIVDSEAEVYTHITSSGNAFSGGSLDYGLNDEICTPRTGVFDFHLLRRYGWRRLDYQCEWASNPRQLFFHLIDYLDRVNAKRNNGTITIPMRPELRMGFPIWIPRWDSFFYIQGISHQHSVGGQSTTTLTLIAKRSKFIAPSNIGKIEQTAKSVPADAKTDPGTGTKAKTTTPSSTADGQTKTQISYKITFPQDPGETSGLAQNAKFGDPQIIRDPKTGKLLGFPQAVMVFQKPFDGDVLTKINTQFSQDTAGASKTVRSQAQAQGSSQASAPAKQHGYTYENDVASVMRAIDGQAKAELVKRLRAHRYEAGMTNAGAYDYAYDTGNNFKELALIPVELISWSDGTTDPNAAAFSSPQNQSSQFGPTTSFADYQKKQQAFIQSQIAQQQPIVNAAKTAHDAAFKALTTAITAYNQGIQKAFNGKSIPANQDLPPEIQTLKSAVDGARTDEQTTATTLQLEQSKLDLLKQAQGNVRRVNNLNMLVRPVSDEFGFEVIGHYRYGRGAFIDRGQIQIGDADGNIANKLNIQFAATGGLLTDGPSANIGGPNSTSFAQSFEDMRPDDYVTGASFDHGVQNTGEVQNINVTGQQTYDAAILSSKQRSGTVVFADADATRRGLTLAELKPTLAAGDLSAAVEKCPCQLGKTDWLSVLPQSALDQILRPFSIGNPGADTAAATAASASAASDTANAALQATLNNPNATQAQIDAATQVALAATKDANAAAASSDILAGSGDIRVSTAITASNSLADGGGTFSPNMTPINFQSFFDILNDFLVEKFGGGPDGSGGEYASNSEREQDDTGASIGAVNPNPDNTATNILGDPTDPLFNAAAGGDPKAIAALQQKANFNFGMTQQALDNFGKAVKGSNLTAAQSQRANPGTYQPPSLPPTQGDVLNPNKFGNSEGSFRDGTPFPPLS